MSVAVGSVLVGPGWASKIPTPWLAEGLMLWTVCQPSDGYLSNANFAGYTGDTGVSMGLGARSGGQGCIGSLSTQQAFAPFNASSRASFADRVLLYGRGGDIALPQDYLVVLAWTRCAITLTTHGSSTYRVYYVVFAGDTLSAASGSLSLDAAGADTAVTGLSFNPSANPSLLLALYGRGTEDAGDGMASLGFASSAANQYASGLGINYNARGGSSAQAVAVAVDGAYTAALKSFNAAGFTISQSAGRGTAYPLVWLLLSDAAGSFAVGNHAWPSAGATINPGFGPEGVIFHSEITGEETTDGRLTVGAAGKTLPFSAVTVEAAHAGVADENDQRRWTAQSTATADVLLDYIGNTGVESGDVEVSALAAGGFTWAGTASGFAGNVGHAAILTSRAGISRICLQGALPYLGVG